VKVGGAVGVELLRVGGSSVVVVPVGEVGSVGFGASVGVVVSDVVVSTGGAVVVGEGVGDGGSGTVTGSAGGSISGDAQYSTNC